MWEDIVNNNGKLKGMYLPAIYLDTTVVIDYWLSEALEIPEDEFSMEFEKNNPRNLLRELFLNDKRVKTIFEFKNKIFRGECRLFPVITPLTLLELMRWHTEIAFKEYLSGAIGAKSIQKWSNKQIGEYLKILIEEYKKYNNRNDDSERINSLKLLMSDLWLNRSQVNHDGLFGLVQADIINFKFSIDNVWHEPSVYSYLQLGAADIMHILLAEHLGCEYLVSFDVDFKRAKNIIEKENGIKVLTNPKELHNVIKI